jgi:hypothetical protein
MDKVGKHGSWPVRSANAHTLDKVLVCSQLRHVVVHGRILAPHGLVQHVVILECARLVKRI